MLALLPAMLRRAVLPALACCLLGACGMKGSLQLPPGPAPEPLLGNLKPAAKPAPAKPSTAPDATTDDSNARKSAPKE